MKSTTSFTVTKFIGSSKEMPNSSSMAMANIIIPKESQTYDTQEYQLMDAPSR